MSYSYREIFMVAHKIALNDSYAARKMAQGKAPTPTAASNEGEEA